MYSHQENEYIRIEKLIQMNIRIDIRDKYIPIYLSHSDAAPAVEEAVRITSEDHLKQEIIDRM